MQRGWGGAAAAGVSSRRRERRPRTEAAATGEQGLRPWGGRLRSAAATELGDAGAEAGGNCDCWVGLQPGARRLRPSVADIEKSGGGAAAAARPRAAVIERPPYRPPRVSRPCRWAQILKVWRRRWWWLVPLVRDQFSSIKMSVISGTSTPTPPTGSGKALLTRTCLATAVAYVLVQ